METDGTPTDDLDVRLRWPGEEHRAADVPSSRSSEETSAPTEVQADPAATVVSTELQALSAGRAGVIDTTLASIAVRLDGLANSTALLRGLLGEQLGDYSNQVHRALSLNSRDLEDYKRTHDLALTDIEKSLRETESSIERVERSIAGVVATLEDGNRDVRTRIEHLEAGFEALAAGISKTGERPLSDAAGDSLDRVADALSHLVSREDDRLEQDQQVAAKVEAGFARQDQNLTENLERLQQSLEALRRRIALRARSQQGLDDAAIERIASAVADRLGVPGANAADPDPSAARRRPKRA